MGSSFSVDLVPYVRRHLALLFKVHQNPQLTEDEDVLKEAVEAYKNMMVLRAYGFAIPTMTLEVEWIWHVHMLHPWSYKNDCERAFGRIIPFRKGTGAKDLPQFSELDDIIVRLRSRYTFLPSTDLVSGAIRQRKFIDSIKMYFQEDPPINARQFVPSNSCIKDLTAQYAKWLKLMRKKPNVTLVPTIGIDLIWHTHMRLPELYGPDVNAIVGHFVHHDDDIAENKLSNDLAITASLWKEKYGSAYVLKSDNLGLCSKHYYSGSNMKLDISALNSWCETGHPVGGGSSSCGGGGSSCGGGHGSCGSSCGGGH